MLRLGDICNKR